MNTFYKFAQAEFKRLQNRVSADACGQDFEMSHELNPWTAMASPCLTEPHWHKKVRVQAKDSSPTEIRTIGPGLSAKALSKALMCLNSNMFLWTNVFRIFWLVHVMKSL